MNIYLKIENDEIHVLCDIEIVKTSFTFALCDTLRIKRIENNGIPAKIESCVSVQADFRPAMKQYNIEELEKGKLFIEYEGRLEGWFLFMQDEVYHFSFYNGWYPTLLEQEEIYEIELYCDEHYELVQGKYNPQRKVWHYSTEGQTFVDCNILLINKEKAHKCSRKNVAVWYFHEEQSEIAKKFANVVNEVSAFYSQLYGYSSQKHFSIVLLPEKYKGMGAYQRTGLTVFAETNLNLEWITHVLCHELGHAYANGAECTTWEDWLNETHAEWNALLYELSNRPQFFLRLMEAKEKNYNGNYLIKPDGDKRPENVHETGTLIYYEIFKQMGEEAIVNLLKIFDSVHVKDTAHLLRALSEENPILYQSLSSKLNLH